MAKTCDTKCFDLAEHFLSDLSTMPAEWQRQKAHELALEIQEAVEGWLADNDPERKKFMAELAAII